MVLNSAFCTGCTALYNFLMLLKIQNPLCLHVRHKYFSLLPHYSYAGGFHNPPFKPCTSRAVKLCFICAEECSIKTRLLCGTPLGDPEEALCKALPAFCRSSWEGIKIRALIPVNILGFFSCPQSWLPAKSLLQFPSPGQRRARAVL